MKLILISLMLLSAPALADKVEAIDDCQYQESVLRVQIANLESQIAQLKLQIKYRLDEGEGYDHTLEIKRKKPAVKPTK